MIAAVTWCATRHVSRKPRSSITSEHTTYWYSSWNLEKRCQISHCFDMRRFTILLKTWHEQATKYSCTQARQMTELANDKADVTQLSLPRERLAHVGGT